MKPMHQTYLPFTREALGEHFAKVKGGADDERHLAYYDSSVKARMELDRQPDPTLQQIARGRQMEKDERFWVASALMSLFHADIAQTPAQLFAQLMRRAAVDPPADFVSWEDALAGELHLFFEVSLPSPKAYKSWLAENVAAHTIIPYSLEAAQKHLGKLEGSTKADAVLLCEGTGTTIIFEAKVLSDVSTRVAFDLTRNQLARIIDVSLEPAYGLPPLDSRAPNRTYVVLLTPQVLSPRGAFPGGDRSRLYGWLMPAYRNTEDGLLAEHLPHRSPEELSGVPARLGWLTWEDCNEVLPGACPWLAQVGRART